METIYKTFRAEVKGVNVETGEVDLFIPVSTMSVDRDGEIVEPSAFRKTLPKFMKRPVLVASHDYKDLTNQIGEWTRLKISDTGMDGKPKYYIGEGNDQADWGFKLASKGMAAFSVGFIPTKWEDGDGTEKSPARTYKEVELLEISQVIVPSNRDAIQSIKSKGVDAVTETLFGEVEKALDELVDKPDEPKEHEKKVLDITHSVSQEEIIDEMDYLGSLITTEGISEKAKSTVWILIEQLMRLAGTDIPDEIKSMFTVEVIKYVPEPKQETLSNTDILDAIKRVAAKHN